ncbi:MAG: hypothetical protein HC905_15390 [Bacteroidales bacterium]|nr:hypothetical protein [Bacteroidales bacterium]
MWITLKKIFNRRLFVILLHLIAWTIFIFYPFIFFRIQVFGNAFYYKQIINAFFLARSSTSVFYYLFPRLIKKIKLIKNVLLLFSLIIFIPLQQYMLEYSLFNRIEENHVQIISPLSKAKIAEFSAPSTRKEIRVIVHRDSITQDRFFKIPLPAHTLFLTKRCKRPSHRFCLSSW